jgi:UDP-glucuronate 4-epimerase
MEGMYGTETETHHQERRMLVLLTGGAGFIGSWVGEKLLERGDQVVCLDNFNEFYDPAIKRANLAHSLDQQGFELCEGDLTDTTFLDDLFQRHRFDAIIHLAAWAGVRPSIERPSIYADVNVGGTVNLLERACQGKVQKFVFASSSSVYGGRTNPPFCETDDVSRPVSPYAATKKSGELLCYTFHHLFGLPINCLRYFTVYGPRQRPEMAIHKFTRRLQQGRPLPLFGDGGSSRDYTYIDDIVDGTLRALDHCEGYDIFNLGESQTTRLIDLVNLIAQSLGVKPTIQWLPDQPGDVPITFADVSHARQELGYAPSVPVETGVPRFVEWYLQGPGLKDRA